MCGSAIAWKSAVFDQPVALQNLVALVLGQLLHLVHVAVDGVGEIVEVERQQLGIGQPHHGRAGGLRQRAAVDEVGIGKMRVPVEVVVDRMVDAAAVFAAEADVERGDPQVVQKRRVIGARAQRADAQVGAVARLPARSGGWPKSELPAMWRSCRRFHTESLVSGSSMSRATPLMNFSSVCEPSMPRKPRPLPSELM